MTDGSTAMVYLFDVTKAHGVYITVVTDLHEERHTSAGPDRETTSLRRRGRPHAQNAVAAITEVDDAATELFGWSRDELVVKRPADFIHPDDFDRSVDAWIRLLEDPGGMYNVRVRHRRKDGSWLWVDIMNHNLLDTEGDVASEIIDASAVVEAQLALSEREKLLRLLTDSLPSGVSNLDPDAITEAPAEHQPKDLRR